MDWVISVVWPVKKDWGNFITFVPACVRDHLCGKATSSPILFLAIGGEFPEIVGLKHSENIGWLRKLNHGSGGIKECRLTDCLESSTAVDIC